MSREQYVPSSITGWLKEMRKNGISRRPYPLDYSDLISPGFYSDPMGIKPERAALTAIVSVRAYDKARKVIRANMESLSAPPTASLAAYPDPYTALLSKSARIGREFTSAFVDSLLIDETQSKFHSSATRATGVYTRLEEILSPHRDHFSRNIEIGDTGRVIENPSAAFCDVYVGWEALSSNIDILLRNSALLYYKKFDELPELETVLEISRNSFDSFILPVASLHKADALFLLRDIAEVLDKKGETVVELHEKEVRIRPDVLETVRNYRAALKDRRSKTTRCAFLTPTKDMVPFLDEPVDFDNPLRDAFDLHLNLLSA